ncbi:MAG: ParA family protein [Sideroxydans sp.]|jgi:chromosome partitioning protein
MSIIAVFNQKGGVGKTTTALNLTAALQQSGRSPCAIDLDPQAQLTSIAQISTRSGDDTLLSMFQRNRPLRDLLQPSPCGFSMIPSHTELAKVDVLFGKGYNVVNRLHTALSGEELGAGKSAPLIMDCSPMIGVLSLNAIFACDGLIVPISADHLSLQGALHIERTLNALEPVLKRRVKRRYLLTRFDRRRRMAWEVLEGAQARFGEDVCRTCIAENVSLAESPALNKTVFAHAPGSRGARDYAELLQELLTDGFIE